MIFWFSGTGNSLSVARQIAEAQGEKLVSIAQAMQNQQYTYSLQLTELVGFVFPVYAWGPPKLVVEFIQKLKLKGFLNQYLFAVCTCGDDPGNSIRVLQAALRKKLWKLNSGISISMPNNYIPMFDVDEPEVIQQKLADSKLKIRRINQTLLERKKDVFDCNSGKGAWLKTGLIRPLFQKFATSAKPFYATEACTACGACQRICPTANIQIKNGQPEWGDHCTQCLACIHRCPVRAIQYGKSTIDRGRYVNPEVPYLEYGE